MYIYIIYHALSSDIPPIIYIIYESAGARSQVVDNKRHESILQKSLFSQFTYVTRRLLTSQTS